MNHRQSLLSSATLAALAAIAAPTLRAQCFTPSGTSIVPLMAPTGTWALDDESRSSDILLPFAFPIGGASYTHVVVESNGEIYLTNGGGVVGPALYGIDTIGEMRGIPGASPRIVAFGGDNQGVAGLATWDILLDDTVAGEVTISWTGMRFYNGAQDFGMSISLSATGVIRFAYSNGNFGAPDSFDWCGLSAGNEVGAPNAASSDLNVSGSTANLPLIYQNVWTPFDLADQTIWFVPTGTGGYSRFVACGTPPNPPAGHYAYGEGCYERFNSFYQTFGDAAAASAALQGHAMLLVPVTDGYSAVWLPGAAAGLYVPPTAAATILATGDDGQQTFTPTTSFPSPWGPVTDLRVHGNAIVAFGANGIDFPGTNAFTPTANGFLNSTTGGVYAWHDYNEAEGGDVSGEEIGGVTYVSFVDMESYPNGTPTATPSTLQFQFDQSSGAITVLWLAVDVDTSSSFGSGHLVGWSAPGASLNPGSIDLATALPVTTTNDQQSMALSAAPAPLSTAGTGTVVDYTIDDAPDVGGTTPTGFVVGLMIWSVAGAELPLAILDATAGPECTIYVGSIDATASFVGPLGPQTVQFTVPPALPPGLQVFAQAVALSSGVNLFLGGAALSNGVQSVIGDF